MPSCIVMHPVLRGWQHLCNLQCDAQHYITRRIVVVMCVSPDIVLSAMCRQLCSTTLGPDADADNEIDAQDRDMVVAQLMITYEWSDWRNAQCW